MNVRVRRWESLPVLAAVALLLVPAAGEGQATDLEVASQRSGVPLPPAYREQLGRDPGAFSLPRTGTAWADARAGAGLGVQGRLPVLLIPALFSDSESPRFSSARIQEALFDGPAGRTLKGFYAEVSGGALELDGTVAPWVRTSFTQLEVAGTSNGLGSENRMGDYLVEALRLADRDLDFGRFDSDGPDGVPNSGDDDGWIDALAFEFAEIAGSCGAIGIWPHLWGITARTGEPYESDDLRPDGTPIRADAYIIGSVTDCSGEDIHGPATMAHELGHTLGLPDIYHALPGSIRPDNRRWVVGCWGLMAAGSWSCEDWPGGEFGPTHLSAWSKIRMGWADVTDVEVVRNREYVLEPARGSNQVLRIPLDETGREYLLLEYRTRTGFDRDLPASGVLVYHEDRNASLRPFPEGPREYRVSVLEADADSNLLRIRAEGGNRGEAGDVFGRDGSADALAPFTEPALATHAGAVPRVTIHAMAAQGDRALVRVSRARIPALVGSAPTASVLEPYRSALTVAGGIPPYRAEPTAGRLPRGVEWTFQDDSLLLEGIPEQAGGFDLTLRVTDDLGMEGDPGAETLFHVSLMVRDAPLDPDRLLEAFFRAGVTSLSAAEETYLDQSGNWNGRYDVGDLRAFLRRTGGIP